MLVNAATGSSKNMTPNWLIATSNGAPGTASSLQVRDENDTFSTPAAQHAGPRAH